MVTVHRGAAHTLFVGAEEEMIKGWCCVSLVIYPSLLFNASCSWACVVHFMLYESFGIH